MQVDHSLPGVSHRAVPGDQASAGKRAKAEPGREGLGTCWSPGMGTKCCKGLNGELRIVVALFGF